MLTLSDRPLESVIAFFASLGIEAGFIVPTETGMRKSILDAHGSLRKFLKSSGIHDYESQRQGEEDKRIVDTFFVTDARMVATKTSMYRPSTKDGDPRICFYRLNTYAKSGNLLALLVHDSVLYVINCSSRSVLSDDLSPCPVLKSLLEQICVSAKSVAIELLSKLRYVASLGWVDSMRDGPTGIGFTLETLLGIPANSSRAPDFKGIEIKSGRLRAGRSNSRTTLFSKVPDWSRSSVSNGLGLLDAYGYRSEGRLQLYCSLSNTPNSLGHYLRLANDDLDLLSMHTDSNPDRGVPVLCWGVDTLLDSLREKHGETFWVKARSRRGSGGIEQFYFHEVIHTRRPLLSNFVDMVRLGLIEFDYVLHEVVSASGRRKSRDHGYLFKIWQRNLGLLFPPPEVYSLVER